MHARLDNHLRFALRVEALFNGSENFRISQRKAFDIGAIEKGEMNWLHFRGVRSDWRPGSRVGGPGSAVEVKFAKIRLRIDQDRRQQAEHGDKSARVHVTRSKSCNRVCTDINQETHHKRSA